MYGGRPDKFQQDPIGVILFSSTNISMATTGAGIGASHQTGWTGLVAKLIQQSGT